MPGWRERLDAKLRPAARDGSPLPLSFAQARQLFIWTFAPSSSRFNLPVVRRIRGQLDTNALERAVHELVRRHEVLRTTFSMNDGDPFQVVHGDVPAAFETVDLRAAARDEANEKALALIGEDIHTAFALDRECPIRVRLFVLAEAEHILLLNIHHIAADGWSTNLAVSELRQLYTAFRAGRPSPLPDLELQYADYASWQRSPEVLALVDTQLDYWKKALASALVLDLPYDRPRPSNKRHIGSRHRFELAPDAAKVAQFARSLRTTPFVVLLTAFDVLLARWSGREDIVVGVPFADRNRTELESVVGMFVNTLAIRASVDVELSFREVIGRVRESTLGAFTNKDVPFERVVDTLNPPRDLGRTPIFGVMFTLHNTPAAVAPWPELEVTFERFEHNVALFDLTLDVFKENGAYHAVFQQDTDLFESSTIERLAGHLKTLLEGALEQPEVPVSLLPMMSSQEREQVLTRWNASARAYPDTATIDTLFEAQVARTPDAIASRCGAGQVTYAQLSARAHRAADQLAAQGLRRGDVFGILADRSTDFLAAILGGWKLGLAYLPLDPKHPPQRIAAVLDQSRVTHVYCGEELVTTLEQALARTAKPAKVVLLPTGAAPDHAAKGPRCAAGPDDLAYVIFTSGSTGTPKGCMLEQRGMINHLYAKIGDLGLVAGDVVAQTASQCFDISVWQFLAPLLVGGRTEVVDSDTAMDPKMLMDEVVGRGVTILEPVPSLLRAMLAVADETNLPLRWCVPTGEALPIDLAREWLARYPNIPLINAYGPTECSDDVTHHIIRLGDALPVMSIGRPVQNTRMYVMRDGLPLGIMELGELHVGGVGVGRGYLNHPTLTAEKFVPDPFSTAPGARLYRTGDLGRWRPDGTLEFLGRIDHQVKVRGFRIELGDIESALIADASVHEAIVLAREDTPGDQRLVAYVTPRSGATIDLAALRTAVTEALPVYMVPQGIIVLPALPLTPNGKVDRKALPAPGADDLRSTETTGEYVAPRTPLEEMLAELFAKSLKVERVSVTDDFFALGGQSLLVMRIVATIRNVLKKEVRVRDFFEGPTVEKLAVRLSKVDGVATPPLVRTDLPSGSVVSFSQDLLLQWEAVREPSPVWTIARAIELQGTLDPAKLVEAVRLTLARQDSLRQSFDTRVPGFAPRLLDPSTIPVELVDARDWTADKLGEFINSQTHQKFATDGSPLIRFYLLDRGTENHILVMCWHTVIQDPTASPLVVAELAAHYATLLGIGAPAVPPLPIRYVDYLVWEKQWFVEGGGKKDIAIARNRMVGVTPHDFRHGKNDVIPTPRPIGARFRLEREVSERFEALRKAESVTPFIALAAVVGVVLSRWTNTDDVVFMSPVNVRGLRSEMAEVAGRFANNVPVTFSTAGNPTWRELLARARAAILDAFSYEWVPIALALDSVTPFAHPLGRVILNIIPPRATGASPPKAGDLAFLERLVPAPSGARGDVAFALGTHDGIISGGLLAAADRFELATIEQQAKNLRELFEQFDPAARIMP